MQSLSYSSLRKKTQNSEKFWVLWTESSCREEEGGPRLIPISLRTGFLIASDCVSYPQLFTEEGLQQCARNARERTSIVFRSFCLLHTSCACILLVYQGVASGHGIKVVRILYTSRVTWLLFVMVRILFFTWKKSRICRKYLQKSESSKYFSTPSIIAQVIIKVT